MSAGSGSTAETVSLAYGPDRSRWQQNYTGNGITETTDYIGDFLELVTSGGVSDYRHYIYAGGEPVAVVLAQKFRGQYAQLFPIRSSGSVANITNSSGAVDVQESFTPFGNRRNPTTWSGAASNSDLTTAAGTSREAYSFQTQLGLWMGMNHMNGRVQDAVTGRFLSADQRGTHLNNTQSLNRYSYVTNNPLTFIDPTGFELSCLYNLKYTFIDTTFPDGSSGGSSFNAVPVGVLCVYIPDSPLGPSGSAGKQRKRRSSGSNNSPKTMPQTDPQTKPQTKQTPCTGWLRAYMGPPSKSQISGADIVGTVGVLTDTGASIATLLDETGLKYYRSRGRRRERSAICGGTD